MLAATAELAAPRAPMGPVGTPHLQLPDLPLDELVAHEAKPALLAERAGVTGIPNLLYADKAEVVAATVSQNRLPEQGEAHATPEVVLDFFHEIILVLTQAVVDSNYDLIARRMR